MDPTNRPQAAPRSRRQFLKAAGVATIAFGAPAILGATDKSGTKPVVIGSGEHQYECHHGWGELPDTFKWGETHGVAIDAQGLVYIKHRLGGPTLIDAIAVFDPDGKFVRSFGKEYHGGGHGIDIRKEGNEEFLYLCDVTNRFVAKTTLTGEQIWKICYPFESQKYQAVKQFSPTNVAFGPDGGLYVADGYGSNLIHQYDARMNWVRTWGGTGSDIGQFKTPHGIWLDNRPGREPLLVVADRANARLQYFTLDGQPRPELLCSDVSFPAHFDIRGTELLVPDLHARVTILGPDNKVVIHLADEPEWTKVVLDGFQVRRDPSRWPAGKFVHPHDACFDSDGNIFVVEWVLTGRVTKLRKVS